MPEPSYEFERFFNRQGFNRSLGHFQAVSGLLGDLEEKYNLADILNILLGAKEIEQSQLSPTLYSILVDKFGYVSSSYNMEETVEDFSDAWSEIKKWKAVDMVIAYHHPELGFTVINPKNKEHWEAVQSIKRTEAVTIYAGAFGDDPDPKLSKKAISACIKLIRGGKSASPADLLKGKYSFEPYLLEDEEEEESAEESGPSEGISARSRVAPERPRSSREPIRASSGGPPSDETAEEESPQAAAAPTAAPPLPEPSGSRRMTPMYSVPVTNELFHNGNVEAWKKIIQSYEVTNPGTQVVVFYEGERIQDINTLFKWGKVKHGSTILFAIVGEDIKDVAKLQRYFRQGASSQFEAFLRAPVNTVLKLF